MATDNLKDADLDIRVIQAIRDGRTRLFAICSRLNMLESQRKVDKSLALQLLESLDIEIQGPLEVLRKALNTKEVKSALRKRGKEIA